MGGGLIGRQAELDTAAEFLTEMAHGGAVLLYAGEPGIGKTTVWLAVVERARASSFLVLSARPAEAEAGLAFAGLADLLEPVAEEVLPELPALQRRALAVALLREDPDDGLVDQRVVAVATTTVLRSLARQAPVVVAVDDLQWLDRPSARVLEFATRRLADLPVGVLASERVERGVKLPLDLERAATEERFRRVELGPLSLGALHQLLKERLGQSFTRRMAVRIEEAAGGNPFFALEIARSLPEDGPASLAALPIPNRLLELVEARILALPKQARSALLAAAALHTPTVETISAAIGKTPEQVRRAFEDAEARGIVEVEGLGLQFTHPLFAAAVYATAPAVERRRMHRRLAGLTEEIEDRARHLALGADGPDAVVATALDEAAEHARARGAPESAAQLVEWAGTLTPPEHGGEIRRRTVQTAEYYFQAGELRRAREMLGVVLEQATPGRERANALRLLGEIHYHENSFGDAIRVLLEALDHVGDDRRLRLAIEVGLCFATVSGGDFVGASEHAARALAVAHQGADPASVGVALAVANIADYLLGRGLDEAKIERALCLEDPDHPVPALLTPSLIAGHLALYEGRLERCDRFLFPLRQRFLEQGRENDLVATMWHLIWSACWQGELAVAAGYAVEAIDSAARIKSDSLRCIALASAAVASAYRGEAEVTRQRAEQAVALASRTGYHLAVLWANWALGLLALSQGDPQRADAALGPLAAMFEDHLPEPIRAFFLPDEIEALIGLGRLDRAERLLAAFDEAAHRLDRPWALMQAARGEALLLAARGDLDGASAQATRALTIGAELELRIEVARTFLVAGQVERRRRRKALAAEHLGRAVELFEQMGAARWAQRARAELGRVGLRPPAPALLTVSERRVAELTASGRTNREVAAQLFMSPKTVEAQLARVYRKLGVRSRAELGAQLTNIGSLPEQM